MGRGIGGACVAIALVSCGGGGGGRSGPPAGADFTEGSRLIARWFQAPGAPPVLVGWYDPQLRFNCSFSPAYHRPGRAHEGGGDFYCLPFLTSGTGDLFADAGCTQPVAEVDCQSSLVELPATADTCDATDRFFYVGAPIAGASTFVKTSAGCDPIASSGRSLDLPYHKLGAEIPLGSFVHARITAEAGGGRIVRTVMSADDGSSQAWGARDSLRGENVFSPDFGSRTATVGPGKWEPEQVAQVTSDNPLFADAACSQAAATFEACGSVTVKTVSKTESTDCGTTTSYYAAGALTAAQVYAGSPASCGPAFPGGATDTQRFVVVDAQMSSNSFADVRSIEQGSDRVHLMVPGTDDGPIGGSSAYLFDTQTGARCVPVRGADNRLRCMPEFSSSNLWADAACSVPVWAVSPAPNGCPNESPSMLGIDEIVTSNACGTAFRRHAFPVGARESGIALFSGGGMGQSCDQLPAMIADMLVVHDLGAELPASSFVELATSNPF